MIKINIDMPMTCEQCRLYDGINYDGRWCLAKYSQIYANSSVERDIDCPLIEEEEGKWIPVSEHYPQTEDEYLVADDRGKVSVQKILHIARWRIRALFQRNGKCCGMDATPGVVQGRK